MVELLAFPLSSVSESTTTGVRMEVNTFWDGLFQVLTLGGGLLAMSTTTFLFWWLLYEFWLLVGRLM